MNIPALPDNSTATQADSIGLIGLGLLGSALGARLIEQNVKVTGFDISQECRDQFQSLGGGLADSITATAACDQIILSLPDSTISRQVIDELLPTLRPGTAIIDTTTGSPADAETAECLLAARQVEYLDATVGGSSAQARRGEAIIMCGATQQGFATCRSTLERLATQVFQMGTPGTGSRMKLVTNLVLGLNRAVLAEGLAFATAQGLDPEVALSVLRAGPASSGVMATKGLRMIKREFTPEARLRQHAKDVDLILTSARETGATVPLSELHQQLLSRLIASGLGDLDNSAIREAF
ncbi:MAG: NAD(P)-dependent oxidoreductase [Planctomycetota bacterium]|jgi:3-hydroxyisobutyrate dehydrogenase-like beta-hydroxyacid dehydrogenase